MISVGRTQVDAKQYGLDGTGAVDDAGAFSAMLADVPDCADVHFEGAPRFLFVNGLTSRKRRGVRLTSDRNPQPDGAGAPTLIYDGQPGGTVLELDRCISCTVEGFAIEANDQSGKRAPAGTLVSLDGDDVTSGEPNTYGSECLLKDLVYITHGSVPGLIGTAVSRKARSNQEYHKLSNVRGNGNGAGIFLQIFGSYNAKGIVVDECTANYWDRGVWMQNGSVHLKTFRASRNNWNLYLEGATEACTEQNSNSEASAHHAYYGVQIDVSGFRLQSSWATPSTDYIVFGAFAGNVRFRNGNIDDLPSSARLFGFENDASSRVVRLEDIAFPWSQSGTTRKRLGLDRDTLSGVGRDGSYNPNAAVGRVVADGLRGITDLPGGAFRFNAPIVEEFSPDCVANATYVVDAKSGHLLRRRYFGCGEQPPGPNARCDLVEYEETDLGPISRAMRKSRYV